MIGVVLLGVSVVLLALLGKLVTSKRHGWRLRVLSLIALLPPAAAAGLFGAARVAAAQGSPPAPESRTLYRGVHYERQVDTSGEGRVTHIVRVELDTKALSFLVTPGDPGKLLPLAAKPASEFLRDHKLEVGIVAGTFAPGYQLSPWSPPVAAAAHVKPLGRTTSRTVELGAGDGPATLYLSDRNEAQIGEPTKNVYNALTGDCVLRGPAADPGACPAPAERIARSLVGLNEARTVLSMVVVDGHRPGVSVGVTAAELAEVAAALGLAQAVHLGAGPQAELVVREEDGSIRPLSVPMGEVRAGTERRVGAVLGVHAVSRLD